MVIIGPLSVEPSHYYRIVCGPRRIAHVTWRVRGAFPTRICRIRSARWRAGRKSMVLSIANNVAHRGVHGSECWQNRAPFVPLWRAATVVAWSLQGHLLGRRRPFNGTAELVLPPAANPEPVRLATQVHLHMNWIEHCRKEATRHANVETAGNRDNSRRELTSQK